MQALYQWQLTGQSYPELLNQYAQEEGFDGADREYFELLLKGATGASESLDAEIATLVDRPVAQLDPVEHSILMLGVHELQHCLDVPYRVVINEAVEVAKAYGGTDGHKFVNGVLDKLAAALRADEIAAARAAGNAA